MPNNCYFKMKITGDEKAVEEFIEMLQWTGPFQNNGLGRVFSFDRLVPDETTRDLKTGYMAVLGEGDCANSVRTSMIEGCGFPHTLESETKRLSLAVEYFSSEPGCAFQEHCIIICGKVLKQECIDYHEHFIEAMDEEALQSLCEDKGLSREYILQSVNCNGEYCEGGFSNFGEFMDLFSFLAKVRETFKNQPIDVQIQSAAKRIATGNAEKHAQEHDAEHDR